MQAIKKYCQKIWKATCINSQCISDVEHEIGLDGQHSIAYKLIRQMNNVQGDHIRLDIISMDKWVQPVSYTHLDVYKRQGISCLVLNNTELTKKSDYVISI